MNTLIQSKILFKLVISILIFALVLSSCSFSGNKGAHTLSNPNSDETTVSIYNYLCELEGKGCLSAQQESDWVDSPDYEMDYIFSASGKYPAMRGLDYMKDDFDGVNERALRWWNRGGLVTICWHTGSDFCGGWRDAMDSEIADWDAALKDGTKENKLLLDGMDKAAKALSELQKQGVTVIWRPFHEFDGQWFWWGKGGAGNFKKLWRLMYKRYTEYWKLNNLIWVLGYSHNGEKYGKWYPGDKYCDIIGADSYDGGAQPKLYKAIKRVTHKGKPKILHECGANPTAQELKETPWLWFMTWHTEYLTDNNDNKAINSLYNDDYIIALDDLPKFK